jgi:amphi-Trp domain-containing protein
MSHNHSKLNFKGRSGTEEVLSHIEEFVAGVRSGAVRLVEADRSLVLHPSDPIEIRMKAYQEKEREQVDFCLSWPRRDMETGVDELEITPVDEDGNERQRKGSSGNSKSEHSSSKSRKSRSKSSSSTSSSKSSKGTRSKSKSK